MPFKLITAVLIYFLTPQLFANEINFLTHNIKGKFYIDDNSQIRGKKHAGRRAFNLELVREMMIIIKHHIKFQEVPFKRGLKFVQNKDDFALFNVTRKPSREDTVKWVGPLQEDITYFFEMKNSPTQIQTLEDAKKVDSICVLNGGIYETFLTKNHFKNLVPTNSYAQCFKMLKKNRVSLTASSLLALPERLKDANIQKKDISKTPVVVFKTQGYLSFSKNISDESILRWQNALNQLKKSGKYNQLINDYLLAK
mgnify:CR=1 FL=1